MKIGANSLYKALAVALTHTADNVTAAALPLFGMVNVYATGDAMLAAYATDRFTSVRFEMQTTGEPAFDFALTKDAVKALVGALKKARTGPPVEVRRDGSNVVFTVEGASFTFPQYDQVSFPKAGLDSVLFAAAGKSVELPEVSFQPDLLARYAQNAKDLRDNSKDERTRDMRLSFSDAASAKDKYGPVFVEFPNVPEFKSVIMPLRKK
ncbi:hypothetical protein AB0H43_12760 [Hamadaea sp. NPDC050747]|uniref:hypothetical protein n=1 Tax=Hamadaea sp. NPDC050747 TaxID=3155789 RepID=UPI00340C0C04